MESNQAISTAEIKQQMQVLQAEKQSVRNEINNVTMKIMAPVVDTRSAFERTFDGGYLEIDTKSSLREELEILEGQERFLDEAIEGGRKELDRVRSQESHLGMSGCTTSALLLKGSVCCSHCAKSKRQIVTSERYARIFTIRETQPEV